MSEQEHALSAVWASIATGWHIGCKCGWKSIGYQTSKAARESGAEHLNPPPPTGWMIKQYSGGGLYNDAPFTFPDKKSALGYLAAPKSRRLAPQIYETPDGDLVFRAEHRDLAATVAAAREGK